MKHLKDFHDCYSLLCTRHLISALNKMEPLLDALSSWKLIQERQNIKRNYTLLLEYFKNGFNDSRRHEMHNEFICQALSLLDQAFYQQQLKESHSFFASQCRTYQSKPFNLRQILNSISDLEQQNLFNDIISQQSPIPEELGKNCEELFNQIWTVDHWTEQDSNIFFTFIQENQSNKYITLPVISALTLSGIYTFNENKILLLAELCKIEHPEIHIRALFGLIVNLVIHNKRIPIYKNILLKINELSTLPNIKKDLETMQLQFINYAGLPEMTDFFKEMYNDTLKNLFEHHPSVSEMEDMFSEDEDGESSDTELDETIKRFKEKSKEMVEMNNEGYDINYLTFSHLKHFPFFQKPSNWFLPFNPHHAAVSGLQNTPNNKILNFIQNSPLCSSDQYSLCFLLNIENNIKNNLLSQILPQQADNPDAFPAIDKTQQDYLRYYIMDCVRYYGHNRNEDFIFSTNISPLLFDYPFLQSLFMDKEQLVRFAFQTQRLKQYEMAVRIFSYIDNHYTLDLPSLQLYGYNLEKLQRHEEAILILEKASIIDPSSKWTMKHLGLCYLKSGHPAKAMPIYQRLSAQYPDDAIVALRYGYCLEHEKKYEKALKQYYKATYLTPNNTQANIQIAHLLLITQNAFEANKYYNKLSPKDMNETILMFAGHAAWGTGNVQQAVEFYRLIKSNPFCFSTQDTEILISLNISTDDIVLMEDLVNNPQEEE